MLFGICVRDVLCQPAAVRRAFAVMLCFRLQARPLGEVYTLLQLFRRIQAVSLFFKVCGQFHQPQND
jgi:hypothetical protein